MAVLFQQANAEAMEGIHVGRIVVTSQLMNTSTHLISCLIGKSNGKNIPGSHILLLDQIGNSVGQSSGLAGAGTGSTPWAHFT